MNTVRLTGPDAGVIKYDLLTALSVAGLNGPAGLQVSLMRLIAAVTARYNWRSDELVVGQRDLARMWSVNERTVKREMKRLGALGILVCTRPGVRGRVGAYRLNQARIAAMSRECWALVGPDFEARMQARYRPDAVKVVQLQDYAEAAQGRGVSALPGTWDKAMARLARQDPHRFEAWYARLEFAGCDGGVLSLRCPSKFAQRYIEQHLLRALVSAVEEELGPIDRLEFA